MSTETKLPTRATKIGATLLLLFGSILAYVFVVNIIARFWDPQAYLQHEFIAVVAGVFLWGGVRMWTRWRLVLAIIWLLLGTLAFLNSTQYQSLHDFPQVPGFRTGPEVLRAMSRASIVMGCVAEAIGVGLLCWHRLIQRQEKLRIVPPNNIAEASTD